MVLTEPNRALTLDDMEMSLYVYKATCLRVVDGDTLDLNIDLGLDSHRHERVRLFGINTPETYGVKKDSEEYQAGMRSKERLTQLVTGKLLWVETEKDKTGKYGRYLATLWVETDGALTNINETLVSEGLAEHKEY